MAVEIFIKVDKSKVPAYQTFADDHGDEISISKLMMFDNVGLGKWRVSMGILSRCWWFGTELLYVGFCNVQFASVFLTSLPVKSW